MPPTVSVCVPAYAAEAFLAETLRSVIDQERPADEIVVSVDPANDRTEEVARDMLAGRPARIIAQPRRLGWVGNTNAALRAAQGARAMIMPHDDYLEPGYLRACLDALDAAPGAAVAYSDIRIVNNGNVVSEPEERGAARERVTNFMARHMPAIAWRGVIDRGRVRRCEVPTFAIGDFAADTLWVARMAAQGEMVRVPRPLYRKRLREVSAHSVWYRGSSEEIDEMWIAHCVDVARAILTVLPSAILDPAFRAAFRSRVAREHVTFADRRTRPAMLVEDWSLVDLLGIRCRVSRRRPAFSWMASERSPS